MLLKCIRGIQRKRVAKRKQLCEATPRELRCGPQGGEPRAPCGFPRERSGRTPHSAPAVGLQPAPPPVVRKAVQYAPHYSVQGERGARQRAPRPSVSQANVPKVPIISQRGAVGSHKNPADSTLLQQHPGRRLASPVPPARLRSRGVTRGGEEGAPQKPRGSRPTCPASAPGASGPPGCSLSPMYQPHGDVRSHLQTLTLGRRNFYPHFRGGGWRIKGFGQLPRITAGDSKQTRAS